MGSGMYRDAAVFERKDHGATDRFGNPTGGDWQVIFESPANLRETLGKEAIAAGRLEASVTGTLRLMASPSSPARAITAGDRVKVRGATWNILAGPIDPKGLGRELEFTIQRGGAVQ